MAPKKETGDIGVKRKFTRFAPDPGTLAWIDTEKLEGEFNPELVALVFEEAYQGCGLVVLATNKLLVADRLRVKVGELEPVVAEVRWRNAVDTRVLMVGLQYAEKDSVSG